MVKKQTKKSNKPAPKMVVFTRGFWRPWRIAVAIVVILSLALNVMVLVRTQMAVMPKFVASNHKVDAPFVVALSQRIESLPLDGIVTTPQVQGEWKLHEGKLLGEDKLVFTPETYFAVNTQYTVTLPTIERVVAGVATVDPIQFTTEQAPSIIDDGLASLDSGQTVAADYVFAVQLSSPNRGLRTLQLRTKPALKLTQSTSDDKLFTWTSKKLLPQGKTIAVEVFDAKNDVSLATKTVTVAKEPKLKSLTKKSYYRPGQAIELVFTQPMQSTTKDKITFNTPGKGAWKNTSTYTFTPTNVKPGKSYSYTVVRGVHSKDGGISTKKYTDSVATTGAVRVTAMSPYGSELSQSSQRISFTFDQIVDRKSAQKRFSVSNGKSQRFEWNGNTMTAIVSKLGYQRTVTAAVSAGVKNAEFGLPSSRGFSVSFTTEVRSKRLSGIPFYHQQYAASCTAASLRMLLARYGTSTSDMSIVKKMGYTPRPMDKKTNPDSWDDPSEMFVGSVDGSIAKGTGAGPDAGPVAKAARAYGRSADAVTGIGTSWVAQQVYKGRGVVLFGALGGSGYVKWKTTSGNMTKMHVTGHARTVVGVVGEPSNPIGFWLNDPLYGQQYWTAEALAANIAMDPYRQAVAVY